MPSIIRGERGVVRWGYHVAAVLEDWTIEGDQLTARISRADRFQLTQSPLAFVVARAVNQWTWAITAVAVEGERLSARATVED